MAEGDRTYYTDAQGVRRLKSAGDGPARPDRTGYVELGAQPEANAGDESRTVAELREALDAGGIEYPSDAKKADLASLAAERGV